MPSFGAAPGKQNVTSASRSSAKVEELVASSATEDLIVAAGHGSLNEELALALLRRRDLQPVVLEALAKNHFALKHHKVLVQMVQHERTPRHISLPMLRRLFAFDLMQVALAPSVAADLKLFAEELLIAKLETLSLGESISLARRASTNVAGVLLLHLEPSVIEAALQNPRTTEACIVKALAKANVPAQLLSTVMKNPKWCARRNIQIAVLRRPEATENLVIEIAGKLPKSAIRNLIEQVKLPQSREVLLRKLESQRN